MPIEIKAPNTVGTTNQNWKVELKEYVPEFRPTELGPFSPLDALLDFVCDEASIVDEPDCRMMMRDEGGFRKLLANMFALCEPDALSEEDIQQLSGINGRDIDQISV
jgi:hypothetical protein